jgi:hypothetical protein
MNSSPTTPTSTPCQLRNSTRRSPHTMDSSDQETLVNALSMRLRSRNTANADASLPKLPIGVSPFSPPSSSHRYNDMRQYRSPEQRRVDMANVLDAALNIADEISTDLRMHPYSQTSMASIATTDGDESESSQ